MPWVLAIALFLAGCSKRVEVGEGAVLFLGDSLTSGHDLPDECRLYPEILGEKWGRDTINLSKSGMRADQALGAYGERIDEIAEGEVAACFLVLGANDQLAGRAAKDARADLLEIARRARKGGARVFVVQSIVPLRSGGYRDAYLSVAEEMGTPLSSDIVGAYLRTPGGTQGDGVHPSEDGHVMIANVLHDDFGDIMSSGQ